MTRVLEDRRENLQKVNFPLRFRMQILKFSREFSELNWFLAQMRKNLRLGFLISFRIITDFQ